MKKIVLKGILGYAVLLSSFTSNAQVIVEENFQGFAVQGYASQDASVTCTFDAVRNQYNTTEPLEGTFQVTKKYPTVDITYTFLNAGVNPTCPVRGGTSVSETRVGTNGFVELTKNTENASGVAGSVTLSKITKYVSQIDFSASFTGGSRIGELYKSTDDGATWTLLTDFTGGTYGVGVSAVVNEKDVMFKFTAVLDRTKIHDIKITEGDPNAVHDYTLANGTTIVSNDQTITVKSPKSGQVEIFFANGVALKSSTLSANEAQSFTLNNGIYLVKLLIDNQVSVQKIIVQ